MKKLEWPSAKLRREITKNNQQFGFFLHKNTKLAMLALMPTFYIHIFVIFYFITARKRSLGEDNVFKPVCNSVYKRGGVCPPEQTPPGKKPLIGRHPPRQTPLWASTPWADTPPDRHLLGRQPSLSGLPLKRAVHILL